MKASDDKIYTTVDVTGIIMPHNWDENGKVIQIAIYTNTEEVYGVALTRLTQKLIKLIHKKVEVKGKIREHPDGNKSIAVQNYIVLEEIVDDDRKID